MPHQGCGGISRPLWQVEWVSEERSEPAGFHNPRADVPAERGGFASARGELESPVERSLE